MTNTGRRPLVGTPVVFLEEARILLHRHHRQEYRRVAVIAPSSRCCQSTWKCDMFVQYILINSWEHTLDKSMMDSNIHQSNQPSHHPSPCYYYCFNMRRKIPLATFRVHRKSLIYLRNNSQFAVQTRLRCVRNPRRIHIARVWTVSTTPRKVTVMKN